MKRQFYLGDSVYAGFDGYSITLTTENGFGPSNTIVLEPEVYAALVRYVAALRAETTPTTETTKGDTKP